MKKSTTTRTLLLGLLCLPLASRAQLYIGSSGADLYIAPGDFVVYEQMKITAPAGGLGISGTEIAQSPQPIGGVGGASILRTYAFNPGTTLSGTVTIFYDDAELNGNNESQLQVAYGSSGAWQTTSGSVVDAVNNTVSNTLANVQVGAVTAVEAGIPLSLLEHGFAARIVSSGVLSNWRVSDNRKYRRFDVERSDNGRDWSRAGSLFATTATGPQDYSLLDEDLAFSVRYYRLKMESPSGQTSYSGATRVSKDASAALQIASRAGGFRVQFQNWQPSHAQLVNGQGQTVRTAAHCSVWEESSLAPGLYILKASGGAHTVVQKIIVR